MSVETVKTYLKHYSLDCRVVEFTTSSATVELAAAALGTLPERIAKTMSFILKDSTPVLVVTAGDMKVDNAKFKAAFASKPKMMTPNQLEEYIGHAPGGVCPFAIKSSEVKTYLDISLKRFDKIFPAAGSASSAVELTTEELFVSSGALGWVDVSVLAAKQLILG